MAYRRCRVCNKRGHVAKDCTWRIGTLPIEVVVKIVFWLCGVKNEAIETLLQLKLTSKWLCEAVQVATNLYRHRVNNSQGSKIEKHICTLLNIEKNQGELYQYIPDPLEGVFWLKLVTKAEHEKLGKCTKYWYWVKHKGTTIDMYYRRNNGKITWEDYVKYKDLFWKDVSLEER